MIAQQLMHWGWSPFFEKEFESHHLEVRVPGRVITEYRGLYTVITEGGELLSEVSGRFRFGSADRGDYPAVGDWVAVTPRYAESKATIHAVLPRSSKFSRKVAGNTTDEQIVAVNVDTVLLVNALNRDFNLRRMERYLILVWESGANPVIVLSKADLCEDVEEKIRLTESAAPGVPVVAVSALLDEGLVGLMPYVQPGQTLALLGSSGAGKSSLANRLMGEAVQEVQEIRAGDDRGRHTTTHRQLLRLPQGGLLIDTPGMRELQLWEAEDGLSGTFADIEGLAGQCRFSDCRHRREPGCAVRAALSAGTLDRARLENYKKLEGELAFLARKEEQKRRLQEKAARKQPVGRCRPAED